MRKKRLLILAAAILFLGCAGSPSKESAREAVLASPARRLESYPATLELPLEERVGEIAPVFLEHLRELDGNDSYAAHTLAAEEKELVLRYLDLLPAGNRRVLESRLISLSFVSGLAGTGLCELVLDGSGKVYVVMAFNPDCLATELGKWMTKRERSAFEGASVAVDCGDGYTGFLYGILHESTHALDYVEPITPFVEPPIEALGLPGPAREPAFTTAAWKGYSLPLPQYGSKLRGSISFYGLGPERLRADDAEAIYDWLDGSPFVSLYGSLSWAEDLAETVTWYHYVFVLGGSYAITVTTPDGTTRTLRPALKIEERPGWDSVREAVYGS